MVELKKVLQKTVKKGSGDCARAAMATLFGKKLDEIPQFFPDSKQTWNIFKYFKNEGYKPTFYKRNENKVSLEEVAKYDGGINGYFYASVPSQTFKNGNHAVIVDTELNVVHDPNPNQLALKLKPEDVASIIVVKDWMIENGKIVDNV